MLLRDKLFRIIVVLLLIFVIVVLFFVFGLDAEASDDNQPVWVKAPTPWLLTESDPDEGCSCVECSWMPCHEPEPEAETPEYLWNRDEAVSKIILYWELFFEDGDAPIEDKRRKNFERYAGYVYNAVRYYQEHDTDAGGRLPRDNSAFELVATIITFESSVRADVVGPEPRCEVGLMQVWGKALAGYDREEVRKKPRLGVMLGVRWLASRIPECYPENIGDYNWDDMDWLGPMSVYAAGERGMYDGKCLRLNVARERVDRMIEYRMRADTWAVD